jgi:hypothetical protein
MNSRAALMGGWLDEHLRQGLRKRAPDMTDEQIERWILRKKWQIGTRGDLPYPRQICEPTLHARAKGA